MKITTHKKPRSVKTLRGFSLGANVCSAQVASRHAQVADVQSFHLKIRAFRLRAKRRR
jgi:hypothetical protein